MNIDWNSVVSVFTAIGVFVAAYELRVSSKIAQSEFEDSIDQQYRELAKGIPVDALIGKSVSDEKKELTRELIYNYLDLCNEQTFLRKNKRSKWGQVLYFVLLIKRLTVVKYRLSLVESSIFSKRTKPEYKIQDPLIPKTGLPWDALRDASCALSKALHI